MAGINLKLLKEFRTFCEAYPQVPFTMDAFEKFINHISK